MHDCQKTHELLLRLPEIVVEAQSMVQMELFVKERYSVRGRLFVQELPME